LNYTSSLEHKCPLFDSDAKNPSSHLNLAFKGCLNVGKCKKNEIGFMVRLVAIQKPIIFSPSWLPLLLGFSLPFHIQATTIFFKKKKVKYEFTKV